MTVQTEEEQDCPKCPKGLPGWMATFADLMALLLSFFVLLLSFSEIDALRFQRLAGTLRNAFGVQNQIQADSVPRGTSIIAQEFSPGRPEPTPLNVIQQRTTQNIESVLDVQSQDEIQVQEERQGEQGELTSQRVITDEQVSQDDDQTEEVVATLGEYLEQGALQVETLNETIVIRVREQSFPEGSSELADEFLPILDRVRQVLLETPGEIRVQGHTDSQPVGESPGDGNWRLSFERALSVSEYLWASPELDQNRFTVIGHGASRPIAPNNTTEGRARNRRVEIVIQRDNPEFQGERIPLDQQGDNVDFGDPTLFGLDPDEIF